MTTAPFPRRAGRSLEREHPVGTVVKYWRGWKIGDPRQGVTIAPASVLGGHTAVTWIDNTSGAIALTHAESVD